MTGTAAVRRDDLDILIAACTSYFPPDVSPEVGEALCRMLAAFDIAAFGEAHAGDEASARPAKQWAVLELMGRRQAIGVITETAFAGRTMITIDRIDTEPPATQHYGPESVYCLTPVTEDQARAIAARAYKTRLVPAALTTAAGDDDDAYDEELAHEGMDTAMSASERAEYDRDAEFRLDAADEARDLEREGDPF